MNLIDVRKRFRYLDFIAPSRQPLVIPHENFESFENDANGLQIRALMGAYDFVFLIEHCCNCSHHMSTQHDENRYVSNADDVLRHLVEVAYSLRLQVRIGVLRFKITAEKRIGAFEVKALYRGDMVTKTCSLHSKLLTRKWPSKSIMTKKLMQFVSEVDIPQYRMLHKTFSSMRCDQHQSYPMGYGPWNEIALCNSNWSFKSFKIDSFSPENVLPEELPANGLIVCPIEWAVDSRECNNIQYDLGVPVRIKMYSTSTGAAKLLPASSNCDRHGLLATTLGYNAPANAKETKSILSVRYKYFDDSICEVNEAMCIVEEEKSAINEFDSEIDKNKYFPMELLIVLLLANLSASQLPVIRNKQEIEFVEYLNSIISIENRNNRKTSATVCDYENIFNSIESNELIPIEIDSYQSSAANGVNHRSRQSLFHLLRHFVAHIERRLAAFADNSNNNNNNCPNYNPLSHAQLDLQLCYSEMQLDWAMKTDDQSLYKGKEKMVDMNGLLELAIKEALNYLRSEDEKFDENETLSLLASEELTESANIFQANATEVGDSSGNSNSIDGVEINMTGKVNNKRYFDNNNHNSSYLQRKQNPFQHLLYPAMRHNNEQKIETIVLNNLLCRILIGSTILRRTTTTANETLQDDNDHEEQEQAKAQYIDEEIVTEIPLDESGVASSHTSGRQEQGKEQEQEQATANANLRLNDCITQFRTKIKCLCHKMLRYDNMEPFAACDIPVNSKAMVCIFNSFDGRAEGLLDLEDIVNAMKYLQIGVSLQIKESSIDFAEQVARAILVSMNTNSGGQVTLTEFQQFVLRDSMLSSTCRELGILQQEFESYSLKQIKQRNEAITSSVDEKQQLPIDSEIQLLDSAVEHILASTVTPHDEATSFEAGLAALLASDYIIAIADEMVHTAWDNFNSSGAYRDVFCPATPTSIATTAEDSKSSQQKLQQEQQSNVATLMSPIQFQQILRKHNMLQIWNEQEIAFITTVFSCDWNASRDAQAVAIYSIDNNQLGSPIISTTNHQFASNRRVDWFRFLVWLLYSVNKEGFNNVIDMLKQRVLSLLPPMLLSTPAVEPIDPQAQELLSDSIADDTVVNSSEKYRIAIYWTIENSALIAIGAVVDAFLTAEALVIPETVVDINTLTTEERMKHQLAEGACYYNYELGTTLTAGTHVLSVIFIPKDCSTYLDNPISNSIVRKSINITVPKKQIELQWTDEVVQVVGGTETRELPSLAVHEPLTPFQLCCRVIHSPEIAGQMLYSHAIGHRFARTGRYLIQATFLPDDVGVYESCTSSRWISIAAGDGTAADAEVALVDSNSVEDGCIEPTIVCNPPLSELKPIYFGDALQSTFTCKAIDVHSPIEVEVEGTFTFTPSLDSILSVGKHQIRIQFTPRHDNAARISGPVYRSAFTVFDIYVLKSQPTIHWPSPMRQLYINEPISSVLSPATVSTSCFDKEGKIFYSIPLCNSFAEVGSHIITATFVPSDAYASNYLQTTAEISVVVIDAPVLELHWRLPSHCAASNHNTVALCFGMPLTKDFFHVEASYAATKDRNEDGNEEETKRRTPICGRFEFSVEENVVLCVGSHVIVAAFKPSDALAISSQSVLTAQLRIEVHPRAVDIVWDSPTAISVQVLIPPTLSSSSFSPSQQQQQQQQLNQIEEPQQPQQRIKAFVNSVVTEELLSLARAIDRINKQSIEGQYMYSIPIGYRFEHCGEQLLKVVFIPIDSINYSVAFSSIILNIVNRNTPILKWTVATEGNNSNCYHSSDDHCNEIITISYGEILNKQSIEMKAFYDSVEIEGEIAITSNSCDSIFDRLLAVGLYQLTFSFSPTNANEFCNTSQTITICIKPAIPLLHWFDNPHAITTLSTGMQLTEKLLCCRCLQSNASASSASAAAVAVQGKIIYSYPIGYIFTDPIDELTIEATFIPFVEYQSNFVTTQISRKFAVTGTKVPLLMNMFRLTKREHVEIRTVLTWSCAPAIEYGTAISSINVLTAKCIQSIDLSEVAGKYYYYPDEGTVLEAGRHSIMVRFVPEDSRLYEDCQATIQIYVIKSKLHYNWPNVIASAEGSYSSNNRLIVVGDPIDSAFDAAAALPTNGSLYHLVSSVNNRKPLCMPTFAEEGVVDVLSLLVPDDPSHDMSWNYSQLRVQKKYNPKASRLLWQPLANNVSLVFGSPLTALQCCATLQIQSSSNSGNNMSNEELFAGNIVYDPPLGTILDAGIHEIKAQFVPLNPNIVSPCENSIKIDVKKAIPPLQWLSYIYDDTIIVEMDHELTANEVCCRCTQPGIDGEYLYSKPVGHSFHAAGIFVIDATFVPHDHKNYATASLSRKVLVTQPVKHPTVLKASLDVSISSIVYGQPLRASMFSLDCTSVASATDVIEYAVSGKYEFYPELGSILPVGTQEVQITFIPNDTVRYTTTLAVVSVPVIMFSPTILWNPIEVFFVGNNQRLTSNTLNASLDESDLPSCLRGLSGDFIYDPPAGHVLAEDGHHTLLARFVPHEQFAAYVAVATNSITVYSLRAAAKPKVLVTVTYADDEEQEQPEVGGQRKGSTSGKPMKSVESDLLVEDITSNSLLDQSGFYAVPMQVMESADATTIGDEDADRNALYKSTESPIALSSPTTSPFRASPDIALDDSMGIMDSPLATDTIAFSSNSPLVDSTVIEQVNNNEMRMVVNPTRHSDRVTVMFDSMNASKLMSNIESVRTTSKAVVADLNEKTAQDVSSSHKKLSLFRRNKERREQIAASMLPELVHPSISQQSSHRASDDAASSDYRDHGRRHSQDSDHDPLLPILQGDEESQNPNQNNASVRNQSQANPDEAYSSHNSPRNDTVRRTTHTQSQSPQRQQRPSSAQPILEAHSRSHSPTRSQARNTTRGEDNIDYAAVDVRPASATGAVRTPQRPSRSTVAGGAYIHIHRPSNKATITTAIASNTVAVAPMSSTADKVSSPTDPLGFPPTQRGASSGASKPRSTIHTSAGAHTRPNDFIAAYTRQEGNDSDEENEREEAKMLARNNFPTLTTGEGYRLQVEVRSIQVSSTLLAVADCSKCDAKLKYQSVDHIPEFIGDTSSIGVPSKDYLFHHCTLLVSDLSAKADHFSISIRGNSRLIFGRAVEFYCKANFPLTQAKLIHNEMLSLSVTVDPKLSTIESQGALEYNRQPQSAKDEAIANSLLEAAEQSPFTITVNLLTTNLLAAVNAKATNDNSINLSASTRFAKGAITTPTAAKRRPSSSSSTASPAAQSSNRQSFAHPQRRLSAFAKGQSKGDMLF